MTCLHVRHSQRLTVAWGSRFFQSSSRTPYGRAQNESDIAAARKWADGFKARPLPRDIGEVTFSRSSGPGGQNVNKVNTKAQLRIPVDRLLPQIPTILHSRILLSRYYAEKSQSLILQADSSRKQATNHAACYEKAHRLIQELADEIIPGETSHSQRIRVQNLQKADKQARLQAKKHHSSKKAARGKVRAE